ncbi:MBL fold metallo-hydrolase [Rhodoferax sp.]|uniref:MBL fold metallo-hydrolase n=1 Tax=Rhodoferax sp. TaxID=50421 RepID=UPI00261B3812|nr:MBL fold metallo-hydrolase [Rhodoferax sp.]MDD3937858.1 MBL fold metallo-hydrolase [Rhodoferax sp.]
MTTSRLQRERLEKPALVYPFAAPPEVGKVIEIAPGIVWMRLPLPLALDHINVWGLEDDNGWAVVDTGMHTDATLSAWRWLFAHATEQRALTRVFVTHMHPDHIGIAGWLTRKFNCRLWMTRLEFLNCRVLTSDSGRQAPEDGISFYRRAGWSEAALESYQARFGNYGQHIHALPDSYRRIKDDEEIEIGSNTWRVIVGTGHSPEHACLYCAKLKLFISGDQVLPRISSNVSVHPTEPDADPMREWLESLAKIKHQVPDDVLVLPSHNECFRGLHSRLDYLAASQERTLDRLRQTLKEPQRVIDVFATLFGRSIDETDEGLLNMATGESVACLNYLLHRGEIKKELDDTDVARYQLR